VVDCDDSAAAPPPADLIVKCRGTYQFSTTTNGPPSFRSRKFAVRENLNRVVGRDGACGDSRKLQETAAAHILL
jgi:hypothetical protein